MAFSILMALSTLSLSRDTSYTLSTDAYFGTRFQQELGEFCVGNDKKLFIGNFDVDNNADLLCYQKENVGNNSIAYSKCTHGYDATDIWFWEWAANTDRYVGDFNGDGKDDLLAHDPNYGLLWLAEANCKGKFEKTHWSAQAEWCIGADAQMYTADFNGDGMTDLLCHYSSGLQEIALSKGTGAYFNGGISWAENYLPCNHPTAQLFLGDFNGDGKTDLLCHDTDSGRKWQALAVDDWTWPFQPKELKISGKEMDWCFGASTMLLVGDFNGDGRSDMLCHETGNGYKWISLANADGSFPETSWHQAMGWCYHDGADIYVGDFNGDGTDDIMCKDDVNLWLAM